MIGEIGDGGSQVIAQRLTHDECCGTGIATSVPKLPTLERTTGRYGDGTPLIVTHYASSAAGEYSISVVSRPSRRTSNHAITVAIRQAESSTSTVENLMPQSSWYLLSGSGPSRSSSNLGMKYCESLNRACVVTTLRFSARQGTRVPSATQLWRRHLTVGWRPQWSANTGSGSAQEDGGPWVDPQSECVRHSRESLKSAG